jgi:cell division protein FtsZ
MLDDLGNRAKIKVIGVGGGGGNAINSMIASNLDGVDFIAANTDCQSLESNMADVKVGLGSQLTKGLGAGANPDTGRNAALEDVGRLAEVLHGCDMVFVTAGMGGGTGTGAAPVIAQVARECGALTVGVVTKPFFFEGKRRRRQADEGIDQLQKAVDSLITIPNDRLLDVAGAEMPMVEAFRKVDEVLLHAVQGITDLITVPGLINVDFADVRTIMSNMGRALMGAGRSAGKRRALEAAQQAIASPLLEDAAIEGATGVLINITGGPSLTLSEVREAAAMIQEAAHEDANIIFGSVIDPNAGDEVRITVIATGFDRSALAAELPTHARRSVVAGRTAQSAPARNTLSHRSAPALRTRVAEPIVTPAMPPQRADDDFPVITLEPPPEAVERVDFPELGERRTSEGTPAGRRGHRFGTLGGATVDEAEIDIPTFLRRQGHPQGE